MKDGKLYTSFTCRFNTYRMRTLQSQKRSAPPVSVTSITKSGIDLTYQVRSGVAFFFNQQ